MGFYKSRFWVLVYDDCKVHTENSDSTDCFQRYDIKADAASSILPAT